MSTKISTGISLSTDYFLRNYYNDNRDCVKTSTRANFSNVELSFEDSRALNRATKRIGKNDYGTDSDTDDSDMDDTTRASIKAFVDTYNNTVTSGKKTDDYETNRYIKQLHTLSKKYSDDLEDLGITVNNDGTLTVNDDLLKTADKSKARKLLSADQEYPQKLLRISRKMNSAAQDNIMSLISSQNFHIDISL